MLSRPLFRTGAALWAALALAAACEKVPLLAPSGSSIILSSPATVLSANGSANVTAQIIEASGTPPHSGTRVSFTTSLGSIQPADADTDSSGRVVVRFVAGGANGTATIIASSGGATTGVSGALKIAVGSAAVGRVVLNASPATVPAIGGSTLLTSNVLDINGNPLATTPVTFTTTAGSLSSTVVTTDQSGNASTTLTTTQQATVTASVGAQAPASGTGAGTGTGTGASTSSGQASASVTVSISAAPGLTISPPATLPSVGLPASFTFAVTPAAQNGSAVRSLIVNWGDGQTQNLGAVTGSAVVAHVFSLAGTYTVSATVTDAAGNSNTVSTAVTVIPVPRPTIIITYSPIPTKINIATTFTVQVTAAQGIGITNTVIDFGDGTKADLGGAVSAAVPHVYTAAGTYTVTVTVTDTTGQVTPGTTSTSVGST